MTENNEEYEITAKIYLLANKKKCAKQNFWFKEDWDLRKAAVVYDPRLTLKDL